MKPIELRVASLLPTLRIMMSNREGVHSDEPNLIELFFRDKKLTLTLTFAVYTNKRPGGYHKLGGQQGLHRPA